MNRILDIDIRGDRATATAEPGIFLAEFQDQLMAQGLFYPPDPTSRKEACLGATVATNATGEDSLLYGSTRCHVRRLKVLLADGTERELIRPVDSRPGREKNLGGYYLGGDPIDLFIGSEGTLGLITEVTVDLIQNPANHFSAIAFFPSTESVLKCVVGLRGQRNVVPRCLEIMDENCLGILRSHPDCFPIPENARAALYFKQEYRSEAEQSDFLDYWLAVLEMRLKEDLASDLLDAAFVAADNKKKNLLRDLRHHIPATINEQANRFRDDGGGKVGTDWWTPLDHIEEAMALAINDSEEIGLPIYVFGHIGNGHPHVNFLVRNAREKELAREAIIRQCRRAVLWGGGVSGEHGIGKVKRHLLEIQHTREQIQRMMDLKRQFDPRWILGRNNLFSAP
jgi:FAD/FMN-containing dehydrogenase